MSETDDLRRHIDAAHQAADKLVQEASARAQRADEVFRERLGDVPERGWEVPPENRPSGSAGSELQIIVSLLGSLREAIPAELSQQLAEAVRELLLAVRALIDFYLDRIESLPTRKRGTTPESRVEDIPIS